MSPLIHLFVLPVLFQLIFVCFFLFFSKKGKKLSNRLLAFFFLSFLAGLLEYYLLESGYFEGKTRFAFLLNSLVILHAPLLLLYTQSLTLRTFHLRPLHLLHTIPFFFVLLLLNVFYFNQTEALQQEILEDVREGTSLVPIMVSVFGFVYELAYLMAIKINLHRYQQKILEQFSNVDRINLKWLNFIVNLFIIFFLASTLSSILRHSAVLPLDQGAIVISMIGLLIFINSVLLKGLHQNEIFLGSDDYSPESMGELQNKESLLSKLTDHLAINKPYLNPDLTLNNLSKEMQIPPRDLSVLINREMGRSFFDLINSYRIEEAKRTFQNSKDPGLTIQEVMYQVGFNSKSSFNTAFKKYTGTTPTAFRSSNS